MFPSLLDFCRLNFTAFLNKTNFYDQSKQTNKKFVSLISLKGTKILELENLYIQRVIADVHQFILYCFIPINHWYYYNNFVIFLVLYLLCNLIAFLSVCPIIIRICYPVLDYYCVILLKAICKYYIFNLNYALNRLHLS